MRRSIDSTWSLILGLLTLGAPSRAEDFQKSGRELVAVVQENFFDAEKAKSWAKDHAGYADRAGNQDEFTASTREALSHLNASHTGYFADDDPRFHALRSIFRASMSLEKVETDSIGIDVAPGGFVRTVFAEGPGSKAGLRRGDKILEADGQGFQPIKSFEQRSGRSVMLTVQSLENQAPRKVVVRPRRIDMNEEWLEAQKLGSRLIERNGKSIGYMPFFSAAGEVYQETLRNAFNNDFAKADALILDFRNGWGGANPTFLNLFDKTPPVLEQIHRDGTRRRYDPQWRKPLFILINGGSKSGKEMVAFAIKKHKVGTLVGERTGGAVLGGKPFRIGDQGLMYLAVTDVLVDGERLEGKGVEPDVEVIDKLEFANGADPQLEKALELAGS